jgi:predicted nucleic acid-binding protein
MAFVVDASVAAGWLLPDERSEIADGLAFRMRSEDALAPDLFRHEARSLLVTALRRNRINEASVYISLDRLAKIPLRNAGPSDAGTVTRLAIRHGLSAMTPPIWTWPYENTCRWRPRILAAGDARKKLASAARAENVPVLGPLGAS